MVPFSSSINTDSLLCFDMPAKHLEPLSGLITDTSVLAVVNL